MFLRPLKEGKFSCQHPNFFEFLNQRDFRQRGSLHGLSTIYSKQGRDERLSSRKLAIARKIWIYHVQELEKLFGPKLFNFRSRFFLLLNLAFSKKSRKIVVLGGLVETILNTKLLEILGSLVYLVTLAPSNH